MAFGDEANDASMLKWAGPATANAVDGDCHSQIKLMMKMQRYWLKNRRRSIMGLTEEEQNHKFRDLTEELVEFP